MPHLCFNFASFMHHYYLKFASFLPHFCLILSHHASFIHHSCLICASAIRLSRGMEGQHPLWPPSRSRKWGALQVEYGKGVNSIHPWNLAECTRNVGNLDWKGVCPVQTPGGIRRMATSKKHVSSMWVSSFQYFDSKKIWIKNFK
jgi:hypothetical protein